MDSLDQHECANSKTKPTINLFRDGFKDKRRKHFISDGMGKRITNLITLIFTYTLSVSFRINIEYSKLEKMKNNCFSLERSPVGTNYN